MQSQKYGKIEGPFMACEEDIKKCAVWVCAYLDVEMEDIAAFVVRSEREVRDIYMDILFQNEREVLKVGYSMYISRRVGTSSVEDVSEDEIEMFMRRVDRCVFMESMIFTYLSVCFFFSLSGSDV